MKNYVSAQTAWALKNAGLPQPKVKVGQAWYLNSGQLVTTEESDFKPLIKAGTLHVGGKFHEIAVYAPTAADILSELGEEYCLKAIDGGFCCMRVTETNDRKHSAWSHSGSRVIIFDSKKEHKSAAEACALNWLAKHSK